MKNNKMVYIQSTETVTLEELAQRIINTVDIDDAAFFIAILERSYQDWFLTEQVIKHFKALEIVYNKEFIDDDSRDSLSPELLIQYP